MRATEAVPVVAPDAGSLSGAQIPRAAASLVREALADTPVVLIHGPRQAGKTTLAQSVAADLGSFRSLTLDDSFVRAFAADRPTEFIASLTGPTLLDEVQRAPEIFLPIKAAVDRDRRPGRFLLTGSANILSLPRLADSLAGRIAIVDLLPLAQAEIERRSAGFLEAAFARDPQEFAMWAGQASPGPDDLADRILRGGFPEARSRSAAHRRDAWFADYIRTLLERDVRDIGHLGQVKDMSRILALIAARTGAALNVNGLSRDSGIPGTSLQRYLDLLRALFLVHHVSAWSNDHGARVLKAPKAYLVDSGLHAYLENVTSERLAIDASALEPLLETFVAMELKKLAAVSPLRPGVFHLRTVKSREVDFVLEARGGEIVGLDVCLSSALEPSDADGLRYLRDIAPDRFRRGILLYTGAHAQPLGPDIHALPISSLWQA